jgi:predicted Zn-ribbon and HTH transcriptional regulator
LKLLDKIERIVRPYAIANLSLYLVLSQGFTYLASLARPDIVMKLALDHDKIFAGEWWRVLTILVMPPLMNPLFALMELYIFYFMGTALESNWGAARYNVYLLLGYLGTILAAIVPHAIIDNTFVNSSVLLAFAALYPDYEFLLFFIFPVKAKWFALLVWIYYLYSVFDGNWGMAAAVCTSTANYLLFFHREIRDQLSTSIRKSRHRMYRARQQELEAEPRHRCAECGITDITNPRAEFRYCPQCKGTPAYCLEHIGKHVHK